MTSNTHPEYGVEGDLVRDENYKTSIAGADVARQPEIHSDSRHLTKCFQSNICQAKPGEARFFQFCFTNCTQGV